MKSWNIVSVVVGFVCCCIWWEEGKEEEEEAERNIYEDRGKEVAATAPPPDAVVVFGGFLSSFSHGMADLASYGKSERDIEQVSTLPFFLSWFLVSLKFKQLKCGFLGKIWSLCFRQSWGNLNANGVFNIMRCCYLD